MKNCYSDKVVANHSCWPFWFHSLFLEFYPEIPCTLKEMENIHGTDDLILDQCFGICASLLPCTHVHYRGKQHTQIKETRPEILTLTAPNKTNAIILLNNLDERVEEERLIISDAGFIGGVGGNLSLFLGFSLIASLYSLCDVIFMLKKEGLKKTISKHSNQWLLDNKISVPTA